QTTLDDYVYVADDMVMEGEVEEGKRYGEDDFNRIIEIQERERKRVEIFMNAIDQNHKTLVFCATQDHALAVRDLINQMKSSTHADYCVRVTANDGDLGEKHLKVFQDNEKTIPTILTTSQKLSTGVDARNIRNIVLMRPINSMIEFKQIIGRGTRIFDGKEYFTIYDFVRAHEHFNDPEWDGEPEAPEPMEPRPPRSDGDGEGPEPDDSETPERPRKLKIKLADGKERTIQHMTSTSFWNPDGTPMSATEFIQQLFGEIPSLFTDEEQLRQLWSAPDTRRKLLEGLEEKGFGAEQLADLAKIIKAEKSDLFDVLGYIAFTSPPKSREERVAARKTGILSLYAGPQQEFLQFVLDQYVESGIKALDDQVLPELIDLKYHTVHDAKAELGEMRDIRDLFIGFQKHLYQKEQVA
ncbi:MAG: restriction endonuclease subunit R, partial [Verrucomicrobia bacterium]|nr:restriction endonuclease subunit R [Verrucomicrobiota bacterium]